MASTAARRSAPSTRGIPLPRRARKGSKMRSRAGSDAEKPSPVVFISPGLKPDVRLVVFKTEYHVHFLILKLHSNYFRKFLDSLDKEAAPASQFRYDYTSVIDDAGIWALEPTAHVRHLLSIPMLNGGHGRKVGSNVLQAPAVTDAAISLVEELHLQEESFRKLLCVMYNRPHTIECLNVLRIITNLADFYCALPIFSGTITGALLGSPLLKYDTADEDREWFSTCAPEFLFIAQKLRSTVLFRECLIHVVGQWGPHSLGLNEEIGKNIEILRLV